jgi:hypothetical protein
MKLIFPRFFDILSNIGGVAMSSLMEKEQAHKLVDRMPENATWDDLIYEIYVREVIERGLADSRANRTKDVKEVRAKYGLPE